MANVEMRGPAGSVMVPPEAVERYRGRGYVVASSSPQTTIEDLKSRSLVQLKEMARERGVKFDAARGKKTDLVESLARDMGLSSDEALVDDEDGVEYNSKED